MIRDDEKLLEIWHACVEADEESEAPFDFESLREFEKLGMVQISGESETGFIWNFTERGVARAEELERGE